MGVRVYPNVPRVYIDMDGVIADFDLAMTETGLEASKLKLIPGTYVNLKPMKGAYLGVQSLMALGFDVFSLTKIPTKNPYAAAEKLIWIEKHFPMLHDRVIISSDKGAVGTARDFLIDDHPDWANASNFRGILIPFGETHKPTYNWDNIILHPGLIAASPR